MENRDVLATTKTKKRLVRVAIALLIYGLFFRGCFFRDNSLAQWGFPVKNSSVILDETPWNLKGEQMFIKANLTLVEAKVLRQSFASQTPSVAFYTPKVLQFHLDDPQWKPNLVKKSWEGSFEKTDLGSLYHCQYIFDVENSNKIVLYFYAITFDD